MKTRYLFVLLALILMDFRAEATNGTIRIYPYDTLLVVCTETNHQNNSVQVQLSCLCDKSHICDMSYSDGISTLEYVRNEIDGMINDAILILTIISIFIALAIPIAGFFGFHSIGKVKTEIIKDVNEHKTKVEKELEKSQNEIENWKNEAKILKKKNETIEKVQNLNNQYLQKVNQWMLNNAYTIANTDGGKSAQSQNLMEESMLNYYLMKLYLSKDQHEINGCIDYIKTKGGTEVIEHLKFIVDNDTDKYKRDKTSEAIGYIRGRFS